MVEIYKDRPRTDDGGCIVDGNCHNSSVHASELIPGFVTFVGNREPGIWEMGSICTCSLRGS